MPAKTPKNSGRANFWLPPSERDQLREVAARLDLSESQVCRRALRLLLREEQHGREKERARVGP
jgi:hypothetical protein